jgi:lipoate-protein ligase A
MITVSEYNLPDIQLLNESTNKFLLWIPDKSYIVLGASNNAKDAVVEDVTLRDDICVIKRRTGGQTVMLTPNNIIISAVITDESVMKPKDVFNRFNELIIDAIAKNHNLKFSTRGISDIALGEKKILGSSMYRGKGKLFYHAVLNFEEPSTTFQKYLKHPSNEPDYRKGRMHHEFVTSLKETGYPESINHFKIKLTESLSSILTNFEDRAEALNEAVCMTR